MSSSSSSSDNLALIFAQIPFGAPIPGQDLTVKSVPQPSLPSNGLTATLLYSSLDPYLRGLLRSPEKESYFPPLPLNGPVLNAGIARVTASNAEGYKEGDLIQGRLPIQRFIAVEADGLKALRKVDQSNGPEDLSLYLGVLGMPGLTAYSSLYEIGQPKKGETIFISSAAGAVGQLVGQLAKHEGLRVVGSVGTDEKLEYLTQLGFDGGFNYKKEKPLEALRRLCPKGVDIYYENVGGEQLEAALEVMNNRGRVVACGMVSQYNKKEGEQYGIKNLMLVVGKRLVMRGFIVGDEDMGPKWAREHQEKVRGWLKDGSFSAKTHAWGIEEADKGFVGMLNGENLGKAVIKF
jgi:NADPH-dependent curcumin reductase CurA